MGFYAPIMFMLCVLISGCALGDRREESPSSFPQRMTDVYLKASGDGKEDVARFIESNLKEQRTFGYIKPYVPVIDPPTVRKVWVPDHKSSQDSAMLIGGHWVYLMIEGPKWFVESEVQGQRIPGIIPSRPADKVVQ